MPKPDGTPITIEDFSIIVQPFLVAFANLAPEDVKEWAPEFLAQGEEDIGKVIAAFEIIQDVMEAMRTA